MIAYLIKMVLCSVLLYGYYHVALRNKLFHQWNRFYLLAIVPLSLLLPLVRIRLQSAPEAAPMAPVQLLEVVSDGNERIEAVHLAGPEVFDWNLPLYCIYTVVVLALLFHFARGIRRINALANRYPVHRAEGVDLVLAPVAGTPFSFFRRIFWNPALDISSDNGRQILQHELVHVRENHTLDKLLLQATLAFCWFNPIFWLLRKELHLVHEFIADERSVKDRDTSTLARLILQAAYPQQFSGLANPFFHHAIKRRLHMLNQLQGARARYLGRVLALPLLACIGMAFAIRIPSVAQTPVVTETNQTLFTVVIDAGHGRLENGQWSGARGAGVYEDEITLAVAQKISALNADPTLKIVLTRSSEANVDLHSRAELAKREGAGLFLSLHSEAIPENVKNDKGPRSGLQVILSRDSSRFNQSRLFGSLLLQSLGKVYTTNQKLLSRKSGIWVLDQSDCPSAILDLGFITNTKDRAFFSNSQNQERIAKEILNAIARYRERVPATGSSANAVEQHVLEQFSRLTPEQLKEMKREDSSAIRQKIEFMQERVTLLKRELNTTDDKETTQELINFLEEKKKELQQQLKERAAVNPIKRLNIETDGTIIAVHADGSKEQLSQKAAQSKYGISIEGDRIIISDKLGSPVTTNTSLDPATDPVLKALMKPAATLTLEELMQTPVKKILCPEDEELVSAVYSTDLNDRNILEIQVRDGIISPKIGESFPNVLRGGTIIVEKRMVRTKSGEIRSLPALAYQIR
jgi:N-acetylmuramoyl-L-alanine amidase